ncbi:MAG: hypothetical protein CR965_02165 [Paludibacter sp.]|nr:MAG: hypothetical protein CR965_02165 [Paludibacter sp.]
MTILTPFQVRALMVFLAAFVLLSLVILFKQESKESLKIFWFLLIVFLPILGSVIYYISLTVNTYKK